MNMIEKVARVLSNFGNGNYQDYTDQAKAAIEAMRGLSKEFSAEYAHIYQTMIDAALKED